MEFILQPWQLFLVILAGWMNRQQQEMIDYLRTENQVLKEKLGKKRILLDDGQRRRLAVIGKVLGRKRLEEVGTHSTPEAEWKALDSLPTASLNPESPMRVVSTSTDQLAPVLAPGTVRNVHFESHSGNSGKLKRSSSEFAKAQKNQKTL